MKNVVKIFSVIIMLILIANISYAKFSTKINGQGKTQLKVPILILEKNDLVVGEINKVNNTYQTDFCLKNYFESTQKINEIDFEYNIKLIPSTLNFPVKYTLLNLDTNEEIPLNENLETNKIYIGVEKVTHRYSLIVNWTELSHTEEVEESLDVKIKINATQIEKENL